MSDKINNYMAIVVALPVGFVVGSGRAAHVATAAEGIGIDDGRADSRVIANLPPAGVIDYLPPPGYRELVGTWSQTTTRVTDAVHLSPPRFVGRPPECCGRDAQ